MDIDRIPSVLALDIGNTSVKIAGVEGEDITDTRTIAADNLGAIDDAIVAIWDELEAPKKVVAASVNPPTHAMLEEAVQRTIGQNVLVIGRDIPRPMDTDLEHPELIGVDRLCCAAAAFDRIGTACVVADFGTAITIDCVNDEGVFVGGAILPGLGMGAESLHGNTELLPLVELVEPDWVFGKDTRQAIVGGLVYGARGALRHFVEAYATELGHWPTVIITGGDAKLVCPDPNDSELVQAIVPDLVLRGVAIAYYRTLIK